MTDSSTARLACLQVVEMAKLLDPPLPRRLVAKARARRGDLEGRWLGISYDPDGSVAAAEPCLRGTFLRFVEWAATVGWGRQDDE
jgi:hypothetical protein